MVRGEELGSQGCTLEVRVQPGARQNQVVGRDQGVWRIRVHAPAREGRANQALVELLAQALGVSKERVAILRGDASRRKLVEVSGLGQEEVDRRLHSFQGQLDAKPKRKPRRGSGEQ